MTRMRLARLGEIATIERESVDPSNIEEGTQYVGLENIESGGQLVNVRRVSNGDLLSNKFRFKSKHILYGKLRPNLAKVARPDFDGICSTDILPVLPGPEVDRGYLNWFLLAPTTVALAASRTAGINLPRLSPSVLAEFEVPLPPVGEQRRIAEILDRAVALRCKRREALAKLDTLIRSIFFEMFGDPVSNPQHWPDGGLVAVLESLRYGPRFYNEAYHEEGTRIVRITDINPRGELSFETMPRMLVTAEDRLKYALRPGDLLFARSGATVGKTALIREADPPAIAGAYFIIMRFSRNVMPSYAREVIRSPAIQQVISRRSRQAAQQNFSGPQLRSLPMPVPPLELQSEFVRRCDAIRDVAFSQQTSLNSLDALFTSLQHRAFRGEL